MRRVLSIFRSPVALAGLVLAAFVLTGLAATFALGGFSLAQEDTPTATTPAGDEATATPVADETPGTDDKEALRDDLLQRLADELGISVDDLRQAMSNVALDLVDRAVADGRITEEEAAEIRERIASGEFPFFFGHHQFHGGPGLCLGRYAVGEVAEFLGIEPKDVLDGLQNGQSLAQIAEANGKTRDELKNYLLEELTDKVNQAVENGRVTHERADEILANAPDRIDQQIDREGLPERPFRMKPGFDMMPGDHGDAMGGLTF